MKSAMSDIMICWQIKLIPYLHSLVYSLKHYMYCNMTAKHSFAETKELITVFTTPSIICNVESMCDTIVLFHNTIVFP